MNNPKTSPTHLLWFSRHNLSSEQRDALEEKLGPIEVLQVQGSLNSVHQPFEGYVGQTPEGIEKENFFDWFKSVKAPLPSIKELANDCHILAIVAPLPIQEQFLKIAGDRPVIMSKTNRVAKLKGGFDFVFAGWEQLVKIEVIKESFA